MKKILLITHKTFGIGLIEGIPEEKKNLTKRIDFVGFDEDEGNEDLLAKIANCTQGDYSCCLVDLQGGTPANVSQVAFWESSRVPIISGVNTEMLIAAAECLEEDKKDVCTKNIENAGKSGIQCICLNEKGC